MQVRKAKEATSEIHEELHGADKSHWTVFPVKSLNNFSVNQCVVDSNHCMFLSNQLGSRIHI